MFQHENYFDKILVKIKNLNPNGSYHYYDKGNNTLMQFHELYSENGTHLEIIMLGNSIIKGVHWNELTGINIGNRGIGKDTTDDMLGRINNIIKEKPKYVFFLGGINDIYKNIATEHTLKNIIEIEQVLAKNEITTIIQSTIYSANKVENHEEINKKVQKLNVSLKKYAHDNHLIYFDLNEFLSENKKLKDEFTTDGIHLNTKGYKVWSIELKKVIKELNP